MSMTQVSTALSREQAFALVDAVTEQGDLAATATAFEDPATGEWVFEATCVDDPDLEAFAVLARDTLEGDVTFSVEPIDPDVNWVARALDGLQPVVAGGVVVHGSHTTAPTARAGLIPIRIDAAQAFGTGHHETTTGCLQAIAETLKRRRPKNPIDIGTGTGVLAIAIARRAHVPVLATDIDPVAVRTALANARGNAAGDLVHVVAADGLAHRDIAARAPYDLVVANILAGPLTRLAPAIGRVAKHGATIILSGLLVHQAPRVVAAYGRQHMHLVRRLVRGYWATLVLEKRSSASGARKNPRG